MILNSRKAFTLIEILIVVAIIAILASVVLVGLGPTQQAGRDARRLSDLHEVQNGFELFYNKCGYYPGGITNAGVCSTGSPEAGTTWASVQLALTTYPSLGIVSVPVDPNSASHYGDWWIATGVHYILAAHLENSSNQAYSGYTAPVTTGQTLTTDSTAADCTQANSNYCITL